MQILMFLCFYTDRNYSKFGGYENGNADGQFVYTGFRPLGLCLKEHLNSDIG